MPRYTVTEQQEDRHGEMTGAISVNMILSMLPVGVWSFFIGPQWFGIRWTVIVAVIMAIVLPIACLPLSRRIWAWLSDRAEKML